MATNYLFAKGTKYQTCPSPKDSQMTKYFLNIISNDDVSLWKREKLLAQEEILDVPTSNKVYDFISKVIVV